MTIFLKAITDGCTVCTTPILNFYFNFVTTCMILIYRGTSILHQVYVFHPETHSRTDFFLLISKGISDRIATSDIGSILTFQTML